MTRRTRTTLLLGCFALGLLFAPRPHPVDAPGGGTPAMARAEAAQRPELQRPESGARTALGALVPGSTQAVSAVLRPGAAAGGR